MLTIAGGVILGALLLWAGVILIALMLSGFETSLRMGLKTAAFFGTILFALANWVFG